MIYDFFCKELYNFRYWRRRRGNIRRRRVGGRIGAVKKGNGNILTAVLEDHRGKMAKQSKRQEINQLHLGSTL